MPIARIEFVVEDETEFVRLKSVSELPGQTWTYITPED